MVNELQKCKDLLDMGVITQQEFEARLLSGLGIAVLLAFAAHGIMIFLLKLLYRGKDSDDADAAGEFAAV